MGFFDQFNTTAEAVNTNPFAVPTNDYEVAVSASENKEFGGIPYWTVEVTITSGPHAGKNGSQMIRLIPWTSPERAGKGKNGENDFEAMNARLLAAYKLLLLQLGIAEGMVNSFDPTNPQHVGKMLGIRGTARIETKGEYTNFKNFQRTVVAAPSESGNAPTNAGTTEAAAPNKEAMDALLSGFGG